MRAKDKVRLKRPGTERINSHKLCTEVVNIADRIVTSSRRIVGTQS